ncbi:hypothetical protein CAOG_02801 [Capsaspora owczarzaki ATCC 30864]|uniref:Uncharacterized protein n=1 Tax=Capsaspora owczarzaki (strain ATCC 30864) TaxID=595528 RepID=A0A0D2WLY5_CAPO3|nr:hypothetical protein CAOG_02801 [Capsaspora owczarzaki ATCC 30864]KJE91705.1 hypothetical protein CAOG_002801 [Capsaspora owczarzaki ATCC 30864]|eukprot:XP_004348614.1 hypothetical protein CAOG_02801 [Capsaspora owczarzaki ATCC 30864]
MPPRNTFVRVPPEFYIPTPSNTVMRKLVQRIEGKPDKMLFIDFARRLEGCYRNSAYDEQKEMRRSYNLFTPGVSNATELAEMTEAQIRDYEDDFLERFHRIMERGNYLMLSQEQYDTALKEDYLFNVRAEINWSNLDGAAFVRFLNRHPELREGTRQPASISDRVLIYHRGVGVDRTQGLFMMEKIDSLLYRLGHTVVDWMKAAFHKPSFSKGTATAALHDDAEDDDNLDSSSWRYRKVERRNLQRMFNGLNLLSSVQLQEPTFKQMVILYRVRNPVTEASFSSGQPSADTVTSGPGASSSNLRQGQAVAPKNAKQDEHRPIMIKSFVDVPMADFEMVLPEKTIQMNPSDQIKIVVAVITCIAAIVFQIFDLEDYLPFGGSNYHTNATLSASSGSTFLPSETRASSEMAGLADALTNLASATASSVVAASATAAAYVKAAAMTSSDTSDALASHNVVQAAAAQFGASPEELADRMDATEDNVLWTLIGIIFTYLMKISFQISAQKDRYNLMMTRSIYHKSMDTQEGVMLYLTDSMLEQEFKEALLAYFFLWHKGDMTFDDLDKTCEQFLETLGATVDFEVEDAIDKLKRDGLVLEHRSGMLSALPLKDATARLHNKWVNHFSDRDVDCPYCPFIENC